MSGEFVEAEKTDQASVKLTAACSSCGKATRKLGSSLTSWIFGGGDHACQCKSAPKVKASAQLLPKLTDPKLTDLDPSDLPAINDRFQVVQFLGEGGMSKVYKALDRKEQRSFAIKLLKPNVAQSSCPFEQEINIASTLNHPNIVAVYEHGTADDGTEFALMDYIDGPSLGGILDRDVFMQQDRATDLFIQICEGLTYAHSQGIVHLDLKPSNILVAEGVVEIAKITDFGIAKVAAKNSEPIVETGALVSTLLYVSPERCRGDLIDSRSDIYSLGCMMYEVLTGKAPFQAENPVKTIMKHLQERPYNFADAMKKADISKGLETIVLHCLEKEPRDRYQFAEEIIKDLELVKEGREPRVARQQISALGSKAGANKMVPAFVTTPLLLAWCAYLSQFDTFNQMGMVLCTLYYGVLMAVLTFAFLKIWHLMCCCWDRIFDPETSPYQRSACPLLVFLLLNAILVYGWTMLHFVSDTLSANHQTAGGQFVLQMTPEWLIQAWLWVAWVGLCACSANLFIGMRKMKPLPIDPAREPIPWKLLGLPMPPFFTRKKTGGGTSALPRNTSIGTSLGTGTRIQPEEVGNVQAANEGGL